MGFGYSFAGAMLLNGVVGEVFDTVAYAMMVLALVIAYDYLLSWVERKVVARIQGRYGPEQVGKYGILQNLADFIKLISKEHSLPKNADKALFLLGIPIMLAIALFLIFILPFSPSLSSSDMSMGMLFVFVVLSFMPLIVFVNGFASGNKFAAISAQRSVVMLVSYELPLLVVLATVCAAAGSYSISGIVNAQANSWFMMLMPIGFAVFFVAMLSELGRSPFDMSESDSELIAGWLTDVSAPYYTLVLFLDYTRTFLGSLLIAILFLGGWQGQFLPPIVWLLLKSFAVSVLMIMVRATSVRMRMEGLIRFGWLWLLPLSLLNLIISYLLFIR